MPPASPQSPAADSIGILPIQINVAESAPSREGRDSSKPKVVQRLAQVILPLKVCVHWCVPDGFSGQQATTSPGVGGLVESQPDLYFIALTGLPRPLELLGEAPQLTGIMRTGIWPLTPVSISVNKKRTVESVLLDFQSPLSIQNQWF
jgi:hypothetical protein